MSNTAIKVENLSKIYRLGEIGTGTISRDLERWVKMKVMGKEDPFLKIGESNDRSKKGSSDIVYSLKDINFEIQQGDAVGIIGRNGAGKSTLLKILSRVTTPTTGKINIKGRVASLLEVGTGFHPELTGRENIYLNGAILGMRKKEIDRKFDEIVDFSGVERYIDTPVKRYSSGMYVRLAFAVAAHLESEILIVDEVLAVGDAEFQKKCLGKMGDISKGEGRTVLFVSHNISAILNLCSAGIYLKNGSLLSLGDCSSVVKEYFDDRLNSKSDKVQIDSTNKDVWLVDMNFQSESSMVIRTFDDVNVNIIIESKKKLENVLVGIGINDMNENRVVTFFSKFYNSSFDLNIGLNNIGCSITNFCIKPGLYTVEVYIGDGYNIYDYYDKGFKLYVEVSDNKSQLIYPDSSQGNLVLNQKWNKI
jgi:lipopolysaccharide transport system ATP-binding protein